MQSLTLPPPTSFFSAPSGYPSEPEDGLAKLRSKFSPSRPEQQSYPSPPMSEPHSPARRSAQTSEPSRHSYHAPISASRRPEIGLPLPPPSSGLFDPRSALANLNSSEQRQVFPGEHHSRERQLHYASARTGDRSPYSNAPVPQNYAYGYSPTGLPLYTGDHSTVPMVQQATMIAPPATRPTKPARRTKAHVASACVNCKKAHLSCDVQRPCGRCVASGKQDTCKDVQHKKRGRPRLRDDREFSRPEEGRQPSSQIISTLSASVPDPYPHSFPALHLQRASDLSRFSGRQREEHGPSSSQLVPSSNGGQPHSSSVVATSPYAPGQNLAYHTLPVAFLNLDLIIQKSNQTFQDLVSFLGDVRGKYLGDLLEARQNDSLLRLCNELRDERDEREPTYMAPITPIGQNPLRPVMENLADRDVDNVSHGFTDRPMYLSFRLPSGQYQSIQVQFRLAKTSLYFVTLVVRLPQRPAGPPLSSQQTVPPTPNQISQTMAAPPIVPARDFTPHHARPPSSTSSTPSSPFFNLASVRTSLPTFSPGSYSSSTSYGYSPTSGAESGYFQTAQSSSQLGTTYPSPYVVPSRKPSATSKPLRELNRPARLEGLHLPPIRTGPAPLGSPLHLESQSLTEREHGLVRRHMPSPNADERRPETPETSKRRRLNIHEVLE
ncbi:hypothetical protein GQ44DRAFT_611463 [Phaeosphaeriaceae sp. PMI808]|nr:hypothetical protein GQ44DRAFT_611463 [Phaeosphaeriaceae sp. PMI808]